MHSVTFVLGSHLPNSRKLLGDFAALLGKVCRVLLSGIIKKKEREKKERKKKEEHLQAI